MRATQARLVERFGGGRCHADKHAIFDLFRSGKIIIIPLHLQHNSLSVVRQYIETGQQAKWKPRKSCLLCSYIHLDKHVSRLAASAINDDRHCQNRTDRRWFGHMASPTFKAFTESCLRRLRHLIALVLPTYKSVTGSMLH